MLSKIVTWWKNRHSAVKQLPVVFVGIGELPGQLELREKVFGFVGEQVEELLYALGAETTFSSLPYGDRDCLNQPRNQKSLVVLLHFFADEIGWNLRLEWRVPGGTQTQTYEHKRYAENTTPTMATLQFGFASYVVGDLLLPELRDRGFIPAHRQSIMDPDTDVRRALRDPAWQ